MRRFLLGAMAWMLWGQEGAAIEYSREMIGEQRVIVCRVDLKKERLQLFLRDDAGKPLKSFEGLNRWLSGRGQKLLFGMNAGMITETSRRSDCA